MKQISNTNMTTYKIFVIAIFVSLFLSFCFFRFLFGLFNPEPILFNPLIFLLIFPVFYYLFFGRFSKVYITRSHLNYSQIFKKGEISLDKILSIKQELVPYTLFMKTASGVVVIFIDDSGNKKKIRFLSKEIPFKKTYNDLEDIIELKKLIK